MSWQMQANFWVWWAKVLLSYLNAFCWFSSLSNYTITCGFDQFLALVFCEFGHYKIIIYNYLVKSNFHWNIILLMSLGRDGMFNIWKYTGHCLDFSQLSENRGKRHFWGAPGKNIGYYTSDQLLEVERRYKVLKTEGC